MEKSDILNLINRAKRLFSKTKMKVTVYFVTVLWLAVITQVAVNHIFREDLKITEAFVKIQTKDLQSSIEVVAEYDKDFLSEEDKKSIIRQVADAIGLEVDRNIEVIKDGSRSEYAFYKKAKKASTELKVVSVEQQEADSVVIRHYIIIRISILQSIKSIDKYKEIIEDTLDRLDVNKPQITLKYAGCYEGVLTLEEKQRLSGQLISELQGEIAQEYDEGALYTVYGFTGLLNEYVVSSGQKVNIQIAITYNEISDKTTVYLATPILNESW